MMTRVLPVGVVKETRALLPAWLASAATMIGTALLGRSHDLTNGGVGPGMVAFVLGSVVVGAHCIGHEYSHRTLSLLLSQPADRRRLLMTKAAVLAPMLGTLTMIALAAVFQADPLVDHEVQAPTVIAMVLLCAALLAPWLTMLSRSSLAASLFALTIPAVLWIAGELIGQAKYGSTRPADIDRLKLTLLWSGMLVLCVGAAISSWRMFMRLEAIDGEGGDLTLPRLRSASAARARGGVVPHPLWLLAKKELRLQQLTFALAALFLVVWTAIALVQYSGHRLPDVDVATVLTMIYFGLLSTIAGSIASAEERQFRTHEWHAVLPMAAWKQWVVKAGVAVGLAVMLAAALPVLLSYLDPSIDYLRMLRRGGATYLKWHVVIVVLLTTGSLYVSSLCGSGIRALMLFFPAATGVMLVASYATNIASRVFYPLIVNAVGSGSSGGRPRGPASWAWITEPLSFLLIGGFLALLLTFAFVNHRSAERSARHMARQALWIVTYLTLASILFTGVLLLSHIR